jgi:hypothetical protein
MKRVLATLFVAGALASQTLAQSNLGELRNAPTSKFTPQDFEMFWAAVGDISLDKKVGDVKTWENSATGNGGKLKLLNVFTSTDGRDCRRLKVDNYSKKLKGSSKQIVCASPDGKWLLDADATPVPKPKD